MLLHYVRGAFPDFSGYKDIEKQKVFKTKSIYLKLQWIDLVILVL